MSDTNRLIQTFIDKHEPTLQEQTLKLGEEIGEVQGAILNFDDGDIFRDGASKEDVREEIVQASYTLRSVALLAGIHDLELGVHEEAKRNLRRDAA